VGDAAAQIFTDPQLLRNDSPTELLNLQQYSENAYRSLDADGILKQSERYLNQHPEPSLLLYRAYAYMLQGDTENSYRTAIESCRLDKRYCTGLMYIGTHFYINKQYKTAERFYQGGLVMNPEIKVGLFQYGNCLQKLGNLREALRIYELDVTCNGPFPTEFMMVDTYIKLGDRAATVHTFNEALRHLGEYPAPAVLSSTGAEAIYRVLDFMEHHGQKDTVVAFRSRPLMQRMLHDFPQQ
jgi:tetratricopeptide (TPR) repeat protein